MNTPSRIRRAPGAEGRKALARLVVARRGELGMTQEEVAAKAGISGRSLQNLEAARTWPQAAKLAAIARALGVDADYLRYLADGEPEKAAS